jgi:transcriptional regulator with XRE-family HTH domain
MSQAELAARAKVSTSTLRRFEGGESAISDYARNQLAQTLAREGILFLPGQRAIMF